MLNKNQKIPADSMYYVYVLIDPRNDQPFYVGKGRGKRVTSHYKQCILEKDLNPFKVRKIKKLESLGFKPCWKILFETLDEVEAYKTESYYIKLWGRKYVDEKGILMNIAPGFENKKARSKSTRAQIRPVDQYDTSGKFIQTFPSMLAAAKYFTKSPTLNIFLCCTKKFKKAYGYFWTFKNEPLDLEWHSQPNKKTGRKTNRVVYQWDDAGNLIKIHDSTFQAAKSLDKPKREREIYSCIQGGWPGLGYRWSWTPESPGPYEKSRRTKKVYQWTMSGQFVASHTNSWRAIEFINKMDNKSFPLRRSCDINKSIFRKGTFSGYQWTHENVSPGVREVVGGQRAVDQYTISGEYIQTFQNCLQAALYCGTKRSSSIIGCCKRREWTAYGFRWTYKGAPLESYVPHQYNEVYQWDLNKKLIAKYPNGLQASIAIFGTPKKGSYISQIAKKNAKCYNFLWSNSDKI